MRRTQTFTDGLAQILDHKTLRKDHGIDNSVVVCPLIFTRFLSFSDNT